MDIFYIILIILCIFIISIPIYLCKTRKKNKIVPQNILYMNPMQIEITDPTH